MLEVSCQDLPSLLPNWFKAEDPVLNDSSIAHPDYDLEKRRAVWLAHLPVDCRLVFIGEAPPPADRYFYYPESSGHDYLFLELMQVLFPDLKARGVEFMRANKPALLRRFADEGYFLVDAVERRLPLERAAARVRAISAAQEELLDRIGVVGHNNYVAIPVKATVQDGLSLQTKSRIGKLFITDRIPFPSNGQQENFRRQLKSVLQLLDSQRTA